MSAIVDLIEEIRLRITVAQSSGVLTNIKRVLVGDEFEARKSTDLPVINIYLESGLTTDIYRKTGNSDKLIIIVHLIEQNLSNSSNTLYKTSDKTGFLYTLEDLLNVLDKNTAGEQDLSFNNKAYRLMRTSWDVTNHDNFINCRISLEISTSLFQIGGR